MTVSAEGHDAVGIGLEFKSQKGTVFASYYVIGLA